MATKGVGESEDAPTFKTMSPTTRVILDATVIYIEQPHLPELQQMTFSNYKNDNTFKALVGISPDGVVTLASSLFPGSISDKSLTRKSGELDLLRDLILRMIFS